jgi:hypothetical protein
MYKGIVMAHEGLAYLVLLSAFISAMLATFTGLTGAKPAVVKIGTILVRGVETPGTGIVALIGLAAWAMSGLPITTWWMWVGILGVVASSVLAARAIKATIAEVGAGNEHAPLRWVALAWFQLILLVTIFAMMEMLSRV